MLLSEEEGSDCGFFILFYLIKPQEARQNIKIQAPKMKGRGWLGLWLHLGQSRQGAAKNGSQTNDKDFDNPTHVDLQGCWLSFPSYG